VLNGQSQEGQGTQGREGKDYTTNIGETPIGCGKQGENRANEPVEDEGTG
jgi:hypothetical protein